MLSKLLDSVMQKSNPGWLDEAIDKAVLGEDNLDKIFSSRKLKEAVIEVQDRRKTSEVLFNFFPLHKLVNVIHIHLPFFDNQVESMLATLSFSDQQVAKICEDPFKSLNALVEDLNVQVNKAKNKKSHSSVKVTYIVSFLLAKSFQFQIPSVDRAREDSVSEELELERSQARSRHGPSVESP